LNLATAIILIGTGEIPRQHRALGSNFFRNDCNEYLFANCNKLVSNNKELVPCRSVLHIPFLYGS